MEILVISCIHNDIENLLSLLDKISQLRFDVVVCPGDFTDMSLPSGFTRADVGRLVIEELKGFGKPLVTVPGSWDKDLIELLRKETVSVHGEGREIGGVGFYGYGGARTPFKTPFEPDDNEIESGLLSAFQKIKNVKNKVQVTHMPPYGTKIDVIYSGAHVGSDIVRSFIEKNKPDAAISSHIHEARGIDIIGDTKLVNAGRFPEGTAAIISVGGVETVAKIINIT